MKYAIIRGNATVDIYNGSRYEVESKLINTVHYDNAEYWEVVTGDRVKEIEKKLDEESMDPYNEYLIIYLSDGNKATFRNSCVDMFLF